MNQVTIRQETANDFEAVYQLIKEAFATTDYSDGTEPDYMNDLRLKPSFIPELSLVAVKDQQIIGQITLTKTVLPVDDEGRTELLLSPISVDPRYFGQGLGTKMMNVAFEKALSLGYEAVFLCGDPGYYSRLGFVPTYKYGIYHVNDKTAEWCMVKVLKADTLTNMSCTIDIE